MSPNGMEIFFKFTRVKITTENRHSVKWRAHTHSILQFLFHNLTKHCFCLDKFYFREKPDTLMFVNCVHIAVQNKALFL